LPENVFGLCIHLIVNAFIVQASYTASRRLPS